MKNSTKILATSALTLAILAGSVVSASAYQGDPTVEGPNYTPERHEAMTQALENGDYETWKSLMESNVNQGRVLGVVNEDNFDQFVEAHNLALAGDLEGAKAKRAELGLGLRDGSGQGRGNGAGLQDGSGQKGSGLRDGSGQRGRGRQ